MAAVDQNQRDKHAIDAIGIAISKGDHTVLHDVDFAVKKGTFVALIGPSGAGKTSLLRVLALLDAPTTGVVRLWGLPRDAASAAPTVGAAPVYPSLTYVPQTLALWPHLSIRENLQFALSEESRHTTDLAAICNELEIEDILDRKPAFVSQGQQQRAALARALVLRPRVLLLDEITAALDERLASRIWVILRTLATAGAAILASTHDPRLALECDRAYRISNNSLAIQYPDNEAGR